MTVYQLAPHLPIDAVGVCPACSIDADGVCLACSIDADGVCLACPTTLLVRLAARDMCTVRSKADFLPTSSGEWAVSSRGGSEWATPNLISFLRSGPRN
jgi:hypothetical protein